MKYEYSENVLVQDSAAALMHDELGWDDTKKTEH